MNYKVPSNIRKIAKRAIEYNLSLPMSKRAAYKEEGGKRVQGTGMNTARKLVNGTVNDAQIIKMNAWFARHGESPKEKEARKDRTSKASIAWALWGGSSAERWVKSIYKKIQNREKK